MTLKGAKRYTVLLSVPDCVECQGYTYLAHVTALSAEAAETLAEAKLRRDILSRVPEWVDDTRWPDICFHVLLTIRGFHKAGS